MKEDNLIKKKSFDFAIRIVNLYKYLQDEKKECIMSKQLMKSGTSVGANVYEAIRGVSRKDFINKLGIALKEAHESEYWIDLLFATKYLDKNEFDSIKEDCNDINRILIAILKSSAV